jgi:hypothetical protein
MSPVGQVLARAADGLTEAFAFDFTLVADDRVAVLPP